MMPDAFRVVTVLERSECETRWHWLQAGRHCNCPKGFSTEPSACSYLGPAEGGKTMRGGGGTSVTVRHYPGNVKCYYGQQKLTCIQHPEENAQHGLESNRPGQSPARLWLEEGPTSPWGRGRLHDSECGQSHAFTDRLYPTMKIRISPKAGGRGQHSTSKRWSFALVTGPPSESQFQPSKIWRKTFLIRQCAD